MTTRSLNELRAICPQCRRRRFIPVALKPYCTRSCKRDAARAAEGAGQPEKVCIGCEQPQGQPHLDWCPVVTGTLASLDRRPS